jgi:prepilin-type N-terminal cleavage/methylation domain-containing protein
VENITFSKKGFTLIELLVVIALIGLLTTVVIPNFRKLSPKKERQLFIGQLNGLTRFAWQQALTTKKLHALVFDFKNNQMRVEQATGTVKDGMPELKPVKRTYIKTATAIPKTIQIKNFIIEGFDEITKSVGGASKTYETFFFILPDGLTQAVTINFIDTKDVNAARKPRQFGLVLNPFTAQFTTHDSFQK